MTDKNETISIGNDSTDRFDIGDVKNDLNQESDINSDHELNMVVAWKNLTLKTSKFLSDKKIILKNINGFVQSGTMMALMGPSGAGKSSLLNALNGFNRNLVTKESKIYFRRGFAMKTCFIAQDVRQHIISGLTVGQSLYYASKLKNSDMSEENVDHKSIVENLINEFAIKDIKDMNIDKCSSGQQKRCVLAMEMCAVEKPDLLCVDEPTSGLDTYSALLVWIRVLKCPCTASKGNAFMAFLIHR